ncbi:MAG TPA: DUF6292 family protein [Pseudonocardiaceae bacterium]|jgi:hypothetical protein|nr:DUF6292 family protein [Pseudonocardiaceae bacterium]
MNVQPETSRPLAGGLAGYVRAVAAAIGVSAEGTSFEISDTATAYLGLARRRPEHPEHDLMLVWTEERGWSIEVETDPAEKPVVVATLGGSDLVPEPRTVAGFVRAVVSGGAGESDRPGAVGATTGGRGELTQRLSRYATGPE